MNDKEDMYLLLEFRQTYMDKFEEFLKEKGKLNEWKKHFEVE